MKLRILLISAFMLLSAGTAWADVEINETNFPDASFRSWLLERDYGSDGKLTDEEIAGVSEIIVDSKGIQSLQGIEYFTAVTYLRCYSNQLTSLDVSQNTELTYLDCSENQLVSLDVSQNTKLASLYCTYNQLTSLDVSKNSKLYIFECYGNQITSLDVSKNDALTRLDCGGNPLTSLDVSKNAALEMLFCLDNQLSALDVSKNTVLKFLDCCDNQLASLDVSKNSALETLHCINNQLASLDVSKNTSLKTLWCGSNKLSMLDVSKNTELTELSCYTNQLTSLDVANNTVLEELGCGGNQLTSLDVSKNTALKELGCDHNQLTSLDVSKNTALTRLDCDNNQLTSLDVSKNTALTKLYCSYNQLASLNVSGCTALEYLDCYDNQLTSLDVSGCTALTKLYCNNNQLTSLNVLGCTALTTLNCNNNQIKGDEMKSFVESLPVVENGTMLLYSSNDGNWMPLALILATRAKGWIPMYWYSGFYKECAWEGIEISEENFPDERFRKWLLVRSYGIDCVLTDEERAAVVKMEVNSIEIQSLQGIEYFTALTYLDCCNNQLASLDVSKNTKLTQLSCYSNQLTSLNVSGCIALEYLFCGWNQLASLDVSGCTALEELYCYSNQLTSLNVSGCTALTWLYCYQNQIKDEAMDALVESLPTSNDCEMRVVSYMKEKNVISFPQVAAARAKGWILYYEDRITGWKECPWEGIEISEENFPDANFRSYLLSQSYGSDEMLTNDEIAGVTVMNVESKNIQNLQGIEYFTALQTLYCWYNQLTSLDVSKNTALKTLDCRSNRLTSLDVSKNTALEYLYCDDNQLTSLDVSTNTALKNLQCNFNQLTSLDVSKNTKLTGLWCLKNQIKGEGMDALIESLPIVSESELVFYYYENEQNEMTLTQLTAAKAKGWIPYICYDSWLTPYVILPPMPDLTPEELLKIEMSSSDMLDWFVDKETKIQGSNVNVTRNIADTEYAVGSIQTADGKTHSYSYFYVPAASTTNPNVGFYLPYNLKGEYDIYLITMPTWTYQNNFDEEQRRYRFRASIWEKNEENKFPTIGTALTIDDNNQFETPEVDANVITDTTFIGTYDFQHAYTDYNTPGVILQINPNVTTAYRKNYSYNIIFAGVVLVSKEYVTKVETVETSEADDSAPWYTINGTLLSGKPTAPGIYIHNGKKVIVK